MEEGLQDAHDQAAHVSRAQGVLMVMHQVSAAQAEALIRSAADNNGEGLL
jgi:AmiR/NasT family two-component response regulator